MWDIETGQKLARLSHDDPFTGLAFAPERQLLTWGTGGVIRLWREESGTRLGPALSPATLADAGTNGVRIGISESGLFSPDGASGILWGESQFGVFDPATGAITQGEATGMRLCPRLFATYFRCGAAATSAPGRFALWDGDTIALTRAAGSNELQVLSTGRRQGNVEVSADGALLLGYGSDGAVVWDAATGAVKTHVAKGIDIYGGAFLGDGARFALRDEGRVVQIFETASGKPVGKTVPLDGVETWLDGRSLSSDGRWMIGRSGALSKQVIVGMSDGARPSVFELPPGQADVMFSPVPDTFATWGQADFVVWKIDETGKPVPGPTTPTDGSLTAIRFSPDGQIFAGLETEQVRLWRTGDTQPFATIPFAGASGWRSAWMARGLSFGRTTVRSSWRRAQGRWCSRARGCRRRIT